MRRLEESDFDALCRTLCDNETMYAYEGAFDKQEAREWLDRQLARYEKDGVSDSGRCCLKIPIRSLGSADLQCSRGKIALIIILLRAGLLLAMGLECGEKVLTVAVLSIIITAPVGAFMIDLTYKKLLKKSDVRQ